MTEAGLRLHMLTADMMCYQRPGSKTSKPLESPIIQ